MGIGEALQWLTKRGSLPGTAELEGRVVSRISEASGSAVLAGGEDAEPREAGIFTITEEKEGEGSPSGSESGSPSGGEPEAAAEVAGPVGETAPTPSVAKCAEKAEPRELAEDFATKLALSDDASTATTGPGEGAAPEEADPSTPAAASPPFVELEPLDQLLKLCGQQGDIAGLPSMEELLGRHVDLTRVKKIGEGTFGEAFKAGNVVLKIVPMEGTVLVNGEPQKRAEEILAEVAITLTLSGLREDTASGPSEAAAENSDPNAPGAVSQAAMRRSNVTAGFVETFGVGICRGRYAEALRKEWHAWDLANGSENDPVDIFEGDQLFVVSPRVAFTPAGASLPMWCPAYILPQAIHALGTLP